MLHHGSAALPAYTFFPYLTGGTSLTFESVRLEDDAAAMQRSVQVLAEHQSAAEAEIWREERLIHRERRVGPSDQGAAG
jgi:hypothetical protein